MSQKRQPRHTSKTAPASRASAAVASPTASQSWHLVAWMMALVALNIAVYSSVGHHPFFTLDDTGYVSENPHVTAGLTVSSIVWAFTTGAMANWHPVTWLSHILDVQLFGVNAGAHHLTSLVLHIANTLLLFWVLRKTTGAAGRSAFVAALFAVHPLHVESVAWISERKDVLSTLFLLLTLITYTAYVRVPSMARYALALGLFALGLMSKPMLVTLPVVLLLIDVWPLRRVVLGDNSLPVRQDRAVWIGLLREKVPFVLLALASSIVTFIVQRQGGAVNSLNVLPWDERLANAVVSYGQYIVNMFWPTRLAVFYPYARAIPAWEVLFAAVSLAAATFAAFRLGRRFAYVPVGWLWYVVTMLPVIGLIQVGTQAMADRYTYVPLIGLFIIIAWGVPDAVARRMNVPFALPVAAAGVVIALTLMARIQVHYWESNLTLWLRTESVTSDNYRAETSLGALLARTGRLDEAAAHLTESLRIAPNFSNTTYNLGLIRSDQGRVEEARGLFAASIASDPTYPQAHNHLGMTLLAEGKVSDAVPEFNEALRLAPNLADVHANLGAALASEGKLDDAIRECDEAIRLNPSLAAAHMVLGLVRTTQGKPAEAITEYQTAARLDPQAADAESALGSAFFNQGNVNDAIAHFTAALRINPRLADAQENLGFLLAANGKAADAVPHLQEAARLMPDSEQAHSYLAMALAGTGRFAEAVVEFKTVLRINPNNANAKQALIALANGGR